jgi:hypothetical protein
MVGSAQLHTLQWLVKGTITVCTRKKECNKYDVTAAQKFLISQEPTLASLIKFGELILIIPCYD